MPQGKSFILIPTSCRGATWVDSSNSWSHGAGFSSISVGQWDSLAGPKEKGLSKLCYGNLDETLYLSAFGFWFPHSPSEAAGRSVLTPPGDYCDFSWLKKNMNSWFQALPWSQVLTLGKLEGMQGMAQGGKVTTERRRESCGTGSKPFPHSLMILGGQSHILQSRSFLLGKFMWTKWP